MEKIRQQSNKYIGAADGERKQGFSKEDLKKFYDRRAEYITGKTETYTVEDAHAIIKQSVKQ